MRHDYRALVLLTVTLACTREPDDSGEPTPAPTRLVLADSVDHLDALAREPMVVAHPNGTLFVTGYWDSPPPVWQSRDQGKTWARVAVGDSAQGAAGNSDSDLAVAPDGTLYLATLVFDRTTYKGVSIHVAVSRDAGATWKWNRISNTSLDDRPWIEVAADGTPHVIWNDGAGVRHAVSTDQGQTWSEQSRVHIEGGSSHLAIGPRSELAVRIVPTSAAGNMHHPAADFLAVSADSGRSWQRHAGRGDLTFQPLWDTTVTPRRFRLPHQPRWVEPIAWDSAGTLYAFWAKGRELWLGASADRGASWKEWRVAEADSTAYYPYLIARGRGELAASFFSGHGDSVRVTVMRIDVPADGQEPRVAAAPSFLPDSWIIPGFGAEGRDTAGEYIPLVFLGDGSLGAVVPIQSFANKRLGFSWRRYVRERIGS